jgi:hypothetical protein
MLKYYIFALIKANLLVFLIFGLLYICGLWNIYPEYHFWIWLISNLFFQMEKPSYIQAEKIDDQWDWIRITRGKKWYHRYLDDEVRKELKNIK